MVGGRWGVRAAVEDALDVPLQGALVHTWGDLGRVWQMQTGLGFGEDVGVQGWQGLGGLAVRLWRGVGYEHCLDEGGHGDQLRSASVYEAEEGRGVCVGRRLLHSIMLARRCTGVAFGAERTCEALDAVGRGGELWKHSQDVPKILQRRRR